MDGGSDRAGGEAELGGAVGRETTAVVGIVDRQLAKGIRELVESGSVGAPEEGGF